MYKKTQSEDCKTETENNSLKICYKSESLWSHPTVPAICCVERNFFTLFWAACCVYKYSPPALAVFLLPQTDRYTCRVPGTSLAFCCCGCHCRGFSTLLLWWHTGPSPEDLHLWREPRLCQTGSAGSRAQLLFGDGSVCGDDGLTLDYRAAKSHTRKTGVPKDIRRTGH